MTEWFLLVSTATTASACISFTWSSKASLAALSAGVLSAAGAVVVSLSPGQPFLFWPTLFATLAVGSALAAGGILTLRTKRWLHRFAIYSGFAATFAFMGWVAEVQPQLLPAFGGWKLAALLTGCYLVGSAAIFGAKTLALHGAPIAFPEYDPSAGKDPWEF
jgi:hypothetical protein